MDSKLIIRVDDVSKNTDFVDLNKACQILHEKLGAEIWYCINIFSKKAKGTVYPDLPMKGRGLKYFVDIDNAESGEFSIPSFVKIVSHGLIHAEHALLQEEAQLMSIMLSCKYLETDVFVPPFISFNETTEKICKENNIKLIDGIGWKSMELYPYEPEIKNWYFHHWRMNSKQVEDWLNVCKVNV